MKDTETIIDADEAIGTIDTDYDMEIAEYDALVRSAPAGLIIEWRGSDGI